jgi:hypothetical protein
LAAVEELEKKKKKKKKKNDDAFSLSLSFFKKRVYVCVYIIYRVD